MSTAARNVESARAHKREVRAVAPALQAHLADLQEQSDVVVDAGDVEHDGAGLLCLEGEADQSLSGDVNLSAG